MLMPVGRPVSAIAAGYLRCSALFRCLVFRWRSLALICGIVALKKIKADPTLSGKGRAWFGIIVGGSMIVVSLAVIWFLHDCRRCDGAALRRERWRGNGRAIRIDPEAEEDRFDRFRLIGWWDQERLRAARVLVVGAGALGNEIIKNLALLGVGRLFVADRDRSSGRTSRDRCCFAMPTAGGARRRWRRSGPASFIRTCGYRSLTATLCMISGWVFIAGPTW